MQLIDVRAEAHASIAVASHSRHQVGESVGKSVQ
jgi:hypothetical protein